MDPTAKPFSGVVWTSFLNFTKKTYSASIITGIRDSENVKMRITAC